MKAKTSKAQKEVLQMKRVTQQETQHLKGADYFAYVRQRVNDSYPFPLRHVRLTPSEPAAAALLASDGHGEYRAGNKKRKRA